jgi:Flp pilus assembly protein TadD
LAYFKYEKLEEAEIDFNFAHQKDPTDPTILFNRGNVYLNWDDPSQRFEEAHSDYAHALQLAPNHVKILHS